MAARRDGGYAMVAAVGACAFFGVLALTAVMNGRSALRSADARLTQAELDAAARSGAALAIHELGLQDPTRRWPPAGPAHQVDFRSAHLTITVEDENGKVPINFVSAQRLHGLFEQAGADRGQIDALVAGVLALRGEAAVAADPAAASSLTSLEQLKTLPGMTAALFDKVAPAVTVYRNTLAFDPATASPLALATMSSGPQAAPSQAGAAGAQAAGTEGRTISIRVRATNDQGGALTRTTVVEFTGAPATPYVIRHFD